MLCHPTTAASMRATLLCGHARPVAGCCPPLRRAAPCRFRPDKDSHAGTQDLSSDPMKSRRLINQLLQIQSLQSVDLSTAEDQELSSFAHQTTDLQQQEQGADQQIASSVQRPVHAVSLFDDPAAEDYDPLVLDMLGFTSVSQYIDSKLSAAAGEAKVSLVGLMTWALLGGTVLAALGGGAAYADSLSIFTDGGLQMNNLVYLWIGILGYFSVKGAVMSLVTGLHSWRLQEAQGEQLEELAATVQAQYQRRAFWQLQGRLQAAHDKANRTYAEFALASLLLGVLLLMNGGSDHLQLQLETTDQEAFLRLLVILWLFWEAFFCAVGSFLKVSQWVAAVLNKLQFSRKWGQPGAGDKQPE